jgi:hypothetical protein
VISLPKPENWIELKIGSEFLTKKWYKRNSPPWKWNFKFKNSTCGRSLFHFQIQYHEAGKLIVMHTDWTNMSKLSDTDWILELEVPFWGRAISFISLLFVINSKIHDTLTWKRSILPNFWVLVKIYKSNPWGKVQTHGSDHWLILTYFTWVSAHSSIFWFTALFSRMTGSEAWLTGS